MTALILLGPETKMTRETAGICKSCFRNVYGDEEQKLCRQCDGLLHFECFDKRRGKCYFCDNTESLLMALRSGVGLLKDKSRKTTTL
jgi:hypothetical protein